MHRLVLVRAAVACSAAVVLTGCSKGETRTTEGPTGAVDASQPAARLHPPLEPAHPPAPPALPGKIPCRAIAVTGDVTFTPAGETKPTPLASGDRVPEASFLRFAEGSRVTVKDPRTTRELTVEGPGRARLCVNDEDEVWLVGGTFQATRGSGESPGSEVLVATPFGAIRYGSAAFRASVTTKLDISLTAGTALLRVSATSRSPSDAGVSGWTPLPAGTTTVEPRPDPDPASKQVAACKASATETGRLAATVAQASRENLGDRAAAHVDSRRNSRADCAMAHTAVAWKEPPRSPPGGGPGQSSRMAEELSKADALWTSLSEPR